MSIADAAPSDDYVTFVEVAEALVERGIVEIVAEELVGRGIVEIVYRILPGHTWQEVEVIEAEVTEVLAED